MHIQVEQKVDLRFACEFDRALYQMRTHRAVRFRPIVGVTLMAASLAWMLGHAPRAGTAVLIGFIFFWGLQLVVVWTVKRCWSIIGMIRALPLGEVWVTRLDSTGVGLGGDRALLQFVRWHQMGRADFHKSGVLMTGDDIAPLFVSARSMEKAASQELVEFLRREWPDRIHVMEQPA